jgi:flagellin
MRINNNPMAVDAQRNLMLSGVALAKSVERLSSGLRINRAADDAAGLSISEKLRTQVRGLAQAQKNAQDGISMIQTAEGAMTEIHDMLQRMRELSIQAANDTLGSQDRQAINTELQQLKTEIDAVRDRTKFNGKALLTGSLVTSQSGGTAAAGTVVVAGTNTSITKVDVSQARAGDTYTITNNAGVLTLTRSSDGSSTQFTLSAIGANGSQVIDFGSLGVKITVSSVAGETAANIGNGLNGLTVVTGAGSGSANFQVGAQATDTMTVGFNQVSISALGLTTALSNFNANYMNSTAVSYAQALTNALDSAISTLSDLRSNLGASQNRLEHAINNIAVSYENTVAAESRIRDADMAQEMATFTRNQILQQAGMAILAQANQVPQSVLTLLR